MTLLRSSVCITMLVVLASAPAASGGLLLWLDPAAPSVDVGDSTDVNIMASFDNPVVGWGLDLTLSEPTYASWSVTSIGTEWNATSTLDGDGLAGLRFPSGVTGEVLLATLNFEGLVQGDTVLTLNGGTDEDEGILLEVGGVATSVDFAPATLTVVPEPATLALLLTSGSLLLRRRR